MKNMGVTVKFWNRDPRVPLVRLTGMISADSSALRRGLSLAAVAPLLEQAFAMPKAKAVALAINSPGGSPVQSSLIAARIRELAAEKKLPVLAFVCSPLPACVLVSTVDFTKVADPVVEGKNAVEHEQN